MESGKGIRLATLENLYLQPAQIAGRFRSRCSSTLIAFQPPGHFVVTGLPRRLARCITLFAAYLSILGATPTSFCCRVSGACRVDYPGKLWKIKNLCR
jgi:hypothetical protein